MISYLRSGMDCMIYSMVAAFCYMTIYMQVPVCTI